MMRRTTGGPGGVVANGPGAGGAVVGGGRVVSTTAVTLRGGLGGGEVNAMVLDVESAMELSHGALAAGDVVMAVYWLEMSLRWHGELVALVG